MKNDNLLLSFLLITAISFLSFFLLAEIYSIRMIPNANQTHGDNLDPIYIGYDREQFFQNSKDNINQVQVRLKNTRVANQDPFIFSLKLGDTVLREVKISGQNIGDDDWVKFQFDKVSGVKGKILSLNLHSETSNKDNSISVYTSKAGDVAYRVYSSESLLSGMKIILSDFLNRFLFDKLFAITYLGIILALIVFEVSRSRKAL